MYPDGPVLIVPIGHVVHHQQRHLVAVLFDSIHHLMVATVQHVFTVNFNDLVVHPHTGGFRWGIGVHRADEVTRLFEPLMEIKTVAGEIGPFFQVVQSRARHPNWWKARISGPLLRLCWANGL